MQTTTNPTASERELVERARGGDHLAFAELVSRHDGRLRSLACRLLHDRDRIDDALQEAYLKAFRNLGRFRFDSSVSTWLYRIATNTCLDELRRRPTAVPADDDHDVPCPQVGPAERTAATVDAARVLGQLAPELRATVVLVHGYGFDYGEASALLGVPPGTVASRLNRARRRLRPASPPGEVRAHAA